MDIRRLQAFAKVYDLRSFSKAGEEMLLSQPTVSAHVMALEEELETQLFDRLGRTVLPTQAGDILYRYCTTIFSQLDHARAEILALSQRVAGELVIGGSTIPSQYIIPRRLAAFLEKYPEVRTTVVGGDSSEIIHRVLNGTVHIGFVGAPATQPEIVNRAIREDELIVIASLSFAQTFTQDADWRLHLTKLPWIMRETGSGTRLTLEQALTKASISIHDLHVVLQVNSSVAVLECVEAGLGVSAISRMAAASYLERKAVIELPLDQLSMRRAFYVIHHGRRSMFPAQRLFLADCER